MRLTQIHAAYWLYHKAPAFVPRPKTAPSIHDVINGHAEPVPRSNKMHAVSMCGFLRHNRRLHTFGQTDRECLTYFAYTTPHPPDERRMYARRWLRRLERKS